jgi:choice-of-anchor A domain-containing protein
LFIFGSLSGFRINQGNVAVGGNTNFKSGNIRISGDDIVGGNLYASTGQVGGTLTIGGRNVSGPSLIILGRVTSGRPNDFAEEKSRLRSLSTTYADYNPTGSTIYMENGEIVLTCDSIDFCILSVGSGKLSTAAGIRVSAVRDATVLVNVIGPWYVSKQNYVISLNNTTSDRILWNMQISGITMRGSILAPNDGTVVGQSRTGEGQGSGVKFTGCLSTFNRSDRPFLLSFFFSVWRTVYP